MASARTTARAVAGLHVGEEWLVWIPPPVMVKASLPGGPVLLVDDVVDSGWTLTVVAALLRAAGCGLVWPLALATSNPGA